MKKRQKLELWLSSDGQILESSSPKQVLDNLVQVSKKADSPELSALIKLYREIVRFGADDHPWGHECYCSWQQGLENRYLARYAR